MRGRLTARRDAAATVSVTAALVAALGLLGAAAARAETPVVSSASTGADPCAEGAVAAWKAVEGLGGVVPEIEEDGTQAPPAWWTYPSPRRAAELFAAEARDAARGLYTRIESGELAAGDIVVRPVDVGRPCGRMAVLAGRLEDKWMLQDPSLSDGATRSSDDAFFVGGKRLRPEAAAYRIRVKADSTLAHVRELERDLASLERTIAERPPRIAKGGRAAVEAKLHELIDEAWSLSADPELAQERRELTGRALALAAALDWPGAAESAAAVLDDALARAPGRPATATARASVHLLAGQPERAVLLAEAAAAAPGAPARARYVLGRALLAGGKTADGTAALRRYLADEPRDVRANRLVATNGREPKLEAAAAASKLPGLRFVATAAQAGAASDAYGLRVAWPISWRVVAQTSTPETGLLIDLVTERVFDDEGAPARGFASLLAQRPATPAARAALVKDGGKTLFPEAKLKAIEPLVPGSRRETFRERGEGGGPPVKGEVTTLEKNGVVTFVVLKAPASAYPKLKDEYAALLKSLTIASSKTPLNQ